MYKMEDKARSLTSMTCSSEAKGVGSEHWKTDDSHGKHNSKGVVGGGAPFLSPLLPRQCLQKIKKHDMAPGTFGEVSPRAGKEKEADRLLRILELMGALIALGFTIKR